jgi:hypothetical protein
MPCERLQREWYNMAILTQPAALAFCVITIATMLTTAFFCDWLQNRSKGALELMAAFNRKFSVLVATFALALFPFILIANVVRLFGWL